MKAFYDRRPAVYEAVGDGGHYYRWNIRKVEIEDASKQEDAEPRTQWECDEVIVYAPVTSNKITQAVIAEIGGTDHEQKLVNEFNAATFGLYGDPTSEVAVAKIEAYKAFLSLRNEVKKQVDADCETLGIR